MVSRIGSYLRAAALRCPDVEQVGPFLLRFDRNSDSLFRNYAIPADGAQPSASEVNDLIGAFARWQRTPRLEYLPELAPAVRPALESAGFAAEGLLPVMTCAPESVGALSVPAGVQLGLAVSDADLLASATVQNIAYGQADTTEHDVDRLRGTVQAGGLVGLARSSGGEPVGSGLFAPPVDGVSELAAVGVVPQWRRRGVALALSTALVHEAFAVGITDPFLMAEGEAEARIYARVGFVRVGRILLTSLPTGTGR